jgi:nucleotide-binding universal stress UspA family protein
MRPDLRRILVPTDFSAPSRSAIAFARNLASRLGASLHLIHVLDDPFVTGAFAPEVYVPPPADLRDRWIAGAEELLGAQLTADEHALFRSTQEVVFGPPARAIADYAATHDIDLIVMGTHGRGAVAHLFIGSVAERVVRTAPCPVLTVREPQNREKAVEAVAGTAAA